MGEEYRDSARQWRGYALLLLVLLVIFIVGFAVMIIYYEIVRRPKCAVCHREIDTERHILGAPGRSLFRDLTENETRAVGHYLYSDKTFNFTKKRFASNFCYLYNIELLLPNKTSALEFLDSLDSPEPPREVRVVLFRGDKSPPVVEEYAVGPLNNIEYHRLIASAPYRFRPMSSMENRGVRKLMKQVDFTLKFVLEETFEASFFHCDSQCLTLDYYTPVSPAVSGRNERLVWYWAHYNVEFPVLNPVDFFILFNLEGPDPRKYQIERLRFMGQEYRTPEELLQAYLSGNVILTPVPFPVDPKMFPFNEVPQPLLRLRSPKMVEPDGHRYSVNQGRIQYMEWDFQFRMSATTGPQLLDVRHRNKRIVYELSLQEIAASASGHQPWLRYSNMVFSGMLLGQHAKSLIPSVDCPVHATFIPVTTLQEGTTNTVITPRAFCVFEHDSGFPLRRQSSDKSFSGLSDISLTLRSILSLHSNEFIIDFVFRLNGALETRASFTGFPMGTFHMPQELRYGFRLRENFIAPVRQFSFHFKVDLDINGKDNRFESIDIEPHSVYTSDWSENDDDIFHQLKIRRNLRVTEQEGTIQNTSESYYLFHNDKVKTQYKEPSAYLVQLIGTGARQLLAPGLGNEPSITWSRYSLAVTKNKPTETRSSSIYSMWDSQKPVVSFQNYIDDNENIIDEVSILNPLSAFLY